MEKIKKILNSIEKTYNDKNVRKAIDDVILVIEPKIERAVRVNNLPFKLKNYVNWFFADGGQEQIVYFEDIKYQKESCKIENYCDKKTEKEIVILYKYFLKNKIDLLIF